MIVEERFFVGYQYVGADLKITNSSILRLLEDMACYHGMLAGEDIRTSPTAWLLSAYKVVVKRRPEYNERIIVRTWSRECRNFFACREFEILSEAGDVLVCAISEWAHYNKVEGKLEKVSDELVEAYKSEPERTNFGPFRIKRMKAPDTYVCESEFTVGRNWIDSNKHMNNVYYLDLAEMSLPEGLAESVTADEFEIFYRQQIKCGDKVNCKVADLTDNVQVSVVGDDGATLHAQICLKK